MFLFSIWRRIPLRVQSLLFNSLPLVAVLLTAGFAFFSNQQREKMEMSVNRHFEMVENLVDIQTHLLNTVAALRAFRLSGDPSDLLPCEETRDVVPAKLERVTALIGGISKPNRRTEKLASFAEVRGPVEDQMRALSVLLPRPEQPEVLAPDRDAPICWIKLHSNRRACSSTNFAWPRNTGSANGSMKFGRSGSVIYC